MAPSQSSLREFLHESVSTGNEDEKSVTVKFGMWIFIATEVLLFGAALGTFTAYHVRYPESFKEGSRHMDFWLGTLNTWVLLTSSLAMAYAVQQARLRRRLRLFLSLALTALIGVVFLGIKFTEYAHHYRESLFPGLNYHPPEGTPAAMFLFMSFYVVTTLMHAVHLTIGIGLVSWLALYSTFKPDVKDKTEVIGLYWHFVDIVWVFLYPTFYLLASR